jgi:hypothetical protein
MRFLLSIAAAVLLASAASAATVGETDRFLPLIHDGAGWTTQVTIVNLSRKPALAVVTFLSNTERDGNWKLGLKTSAGKINGSVVDVPLAPGAMAVIETAGTEKELSRGFAEIFEISNNAIGAFATLTQRDGDRIVQSFKIALAPGHERRSVLSLDLTDPQIKPELVFVTLTTTTTLDIVFRNLAGEQVLTDQLYLDNKTQFFLSARAQWPQLKDFRGTMEWNVSFPGADRYEPRYLAGLNLVVRDGLPWTILTGMTLPADQAPTAPY